jgi:hypothetical protein
MTEYITKEQVLKMLPSGGVDDPVVFESTELLRRFINLAFEQRLEVVGYATKGTMIEREIVKRGPVFLNNTNDKLFAVPLYTLKGDSK